MYITAKLLKGTSVQGRLHVRILVVEDERKLAEAMEQVLRKNNYSVDLAFDGEFGLDCALTGIYDLIILDLMLPKLDGISILQVIRRNKLGTPVVLLTAKSDTEDKVRGLDNGADDYLAKPFEMEELLARIRAIARRNGDLIHHNIYRYNDIEYNPQTLDIRCKGKSFRLTLKEGQLLELLIKHSKRILSTSTIIEKIWGFETETEDNHVQVYVSFLRKKLSLLQSDVKIKAVRGAGYVLTVTEDGLKDVQATTE